MIKKLIRDEYLETDNIGVFCPYWTIVESGEVFVADTFDEMVTIIPNEDRIIDLVAVSELLSHSYMFGDRTLIQNVRRMPWHSRLNSDGKLTRRPPLRHSIVEHDFELLCEKFSNLLLLELEEAIGTHKRVFLLLSGGLDIRIVAAVMRKISVQNGTQIVCISWGNSNSRDVEYAKRIANLYKWDFENIPYDSCLTWENINRGAIWGGSEATGIHLHNMHWFSKNAVRDDLVIAASFGDSIGRAEFETSHLLDKVMKPLHNPFGIMPENIFSFSREESAKDLVLPLVESYYIPDYVRNEIILQENYMRRKINHSMQYIRSFCDLHQAFTSRDLVKLMWSISPRRRNERIYFRTLERFDRRLMDIPWARSGVSPSGVNEMNLELTANHHSIPKWLKHDLEDKIEKEIYSGFLEESYLDRFETV